MLTNSRLVSQQHAAWLAAKYLAHATHLPQHRVIPVSVRLEAVIAAVVVPYQAALGLLHAHTMGMRDLWGPQLQLGDPGVERCNLVQSLHSLLPLTPAGTQAGSQAVKLSQNLEDPPVIGALTCIH